MTILDHRCDSRVLLVLVVLEELVRAVQRIKIANDEGLARESRTRCEETRATRIEQNVDGRIAL